MGGASACKRIRHSRVTTHPACRTRSHPARAGRRKAPHSAGGLARDVRSSAYSRLGVCRGRLAGRWRRGVARPRCFNAPRHIHRPLLRLLPVESLPQRRPGVQTAHAAWDSRASMFSISPTTSAMIGSTRGTQLQVDDSAGRAQRPAPRAVRRFIHAVLFGALVASAAPFARAAPRDLVSKPAPGFALTDLNGRPLRLSRLPRQGGSAQLLGYVVWTLQG